MRKNLPHCRDCGEPIKWAKTFQGKNVAFDASPDPNGTWLVGKQKTGTPVKEHTMCTSLERNEALSLQAQGELLWKPHAATCAARPRATEKLTKEQIEALVAPLNLREPKRRRRHGRSRT